MVTIAASYGCGNSDFSGGNGIIKKRVDPPKPPPSPPEVTKPDTPGLNADNGGSIACVRGDSAKTFSFSIAHHKDTVSGKRDAMPQMDVAESAVQKFNVSLIAGDILPVGRFGLDDVAFIVKESDVFQARGRDIRIPDHALIIKDGNNVNGASGSVDAKGPTVYRYKAGQVTIGTNQQSLASALNRIAGMGITPINHNQIKISDMRAKGFVDANGDVTFKVIHVAHGFGFLKMDYTLQPCK